MREESGGKAQSGGPAVAHASVVSGEGGGQLTIWPAGHYQGDLGDPRLNQRAALYAEAILDKGLAKAPRSLRKVFDGASGKVEIEFEFPASAGAS